MVLLNTFQLVNENRVISPVLTTTREYGMWMEKNFDPAICQLELYLSSKKQGGEDVLEMHPGTKIGAWFSKKKPTGQNMQSWFILQDSKMMNWLKRYKLAEFRDAIPISVNDTEGRRMIRCYTVEQIQLYVQSVIDPSFRVQFATPKQIKIRESDFNKLIIPEVPKERKRLF